MTGYPPGGPPPAARVRPRGARGGGRDRARCDGIVALVGGPRVRPRPRERRVRLRGRCRAGRLPQAVPPELRRLRRAPLLRRRPRAPAAPRSATSSSARRSARTSGSRARRPPTSRSPARRSSSTSPRRRSTSARRRTARRCSSRGPGTTPPTSRSATSSAGRTSSSSTATPSCSTTRARSSRERRGSRRRCSSSTSTRPRRSAAGCATCGAASSSGRATAPPVATTLELGAPREASDDRRARPSTPFATGARADAARARARRSATTSRRTASATSSISISGGIDSALTAAIAADALGAEHVHTVSMPSRFSSEGTRDDAREVSENLGVDFREIPIEAIVDGVPRGARRARGLAAENLQARIRGTMLMALSNTHGWLVVATGNKSEMAVGYATIYGDMVGGLRAPQGRLQDGRLPARAAPERARRAAS